MLAKRHVAGLGALVQIQLTVLLPDGLVISVMAFLESLFRSLGSNCSTQSQTSGGLYGNIVSHKIPTLSDQLKAQTDRSAKRVLRLSQTQDICSIACNSLQFGSSASDSLPTQTICHALKYYLFSEVSITYSWLGVVPRLALALRLAKLLAPGVQDVPALLLDDSLTNNSAHRHVSAQSSIAKKC